MKKILLMALLALIAVACNNNDEPLPETGGKPAEALITFDVQSIESPDNLKVFYQSPDPGCGMPYSYDIYCDYKANELVLKCKNLEEINLEKYGQIVLREDWSDKVTIYPGATSSTCEAAGFTVTVVDKNTLKFVFDEVEKPVEENDIRCVFVWLTVVDPANPKKIKEEINIQRIFDWLLTD